MHIISRLTRQEHLLMTTKFLARCTCVWDDVTLLQIVWWCHVEVLSLARRYFVACVSDNETNKNSKGSGYITLNYMQAAAFLYGQNMCGLLTDCKLHKNRTKLVQFNVTSSRHAFSFYKLSREKSCGWRQYEIGRILAKENRQATDKNAQITFTQIVGTIMLLSARTLEHSCEELRLE